MTGRHHNRFTPPPLPHGSPLTPGSPSTHGTMCAHGSPRRRPRGAWACHSAHGWPSHDVTPRHPHAFTLTELLVAVVIILVIMSLVGAAVSAARKSAKVNDTRATIDKLNQIIAQQYSTYASRAVTSATTAALRASGIRRIISADLPDNWNDVQRIAGETEQVVPSVPAAGTFPNNASQRAYAAIWNGLSAAQQGAVGSQVGDAECLFMIVMRGGVADCLDCGALRTTDVGDTDNDGMPEFLDAWGNPIRYVLWPAGLELPPGSGMKFFSTDVPFLGPAVGRVMRPLIFSEGPDKLNATVLSGGNLALNQDCGNPQNAKVATFGGVVSSDRSMNLLDNITNFDAEAKQ